MSDAMRELESSMPDADRRDAALQRILERVYADGVDLVDGRLVERSATDELSDGDLLVLQALSHGLTADQAAEIAGVSFDAVKSRMKKARRVLRAKNTTHAVVNAVRQGLIP